jgi:DNA-binding IclR family transcriptional regulator
MTTERIRALPGLSTTTTAAGRRRCPGAPCTLQLRHARYSCAMGDKPHGGVRSVHRALRALELIAEEGELGVTDLGRGLGVHKATASRLAATLADGGLIERDPVTDRYRLGFGLIRLVGAAMASIDLVRTAHPVLEELADRTRETVNIGVLSGSGVVYVDQVSSAHLIASTNWVGRRTPLHASSSGKVLLAHMPEAVRQRFLGRPLEAVTPRTVTDPAVLLRQLEEVRTRGYATIRDELEEGLNAVAAPVWQLGGEVAAALSISGPSFRVRSVDLARLGRLAIDAAGAVSRRLGWTGAAHEPGRWR